MARLSDRIGRIKSLLPSPDNWSEDIASVCPECLLPIPAQLFVSDGRVWMTKTCPVHGDSRALIASDAAEYLRYRQFVPDRSGANCCCGPGESCNGGPPVCVLLLEITQACNLRCPTCFADAQGHDFMSIAEVRSRLDSFFEKQAALDVLMLSGGEPTIHPRFDEILALALAYPVGRVLVNTNGLRLTQSDTVMGAIAANRSRVELFLSFSSFRADVHERLYGRDLRAEKIDAIDRAGEADVFVTLVPIIEHGVNDDEIGDLYRFALSKRNINGINFQPAMTAGRYEHGHSPEARTTLTDVIAAIEEQSGGHLLRSDFVGLPCSHPDCCVLTYGFLNPNRTRISPLPRFLDIARYMDLFADRISFAGLIGGALRRVWSDMAHVRAGQTACDLATLFATAGIRDMLPLIGKPDEFGQRVLRIAVKPFMDAHTYDRSRVEQCCTKIIDSSDAPVSLCEYNVFHRNAHPSASRGRVALTMIT